MNRSLLFAALCLLITVQVQAQTKLSSSTFGQIEARSIGPAVMGGRITAIEGVNSNPKILYVGSAGGGVWKTTTAGFSFEPVFEKYPQSIGALAIDQNHPDTLWVGTGECNMRNSVSVGLGIYRSTDGGRNWTKKGLDNSEHISKIIIHPNDANTVFVAVPGKLWSDSPDRGLYKTTDGGKTWEKSCTPTKNGLRRYYHGSPQSGRPSCLYVAIQTYALFLRIRRPWQCAVQIHRRW
ncbi:MAG: hypothetical protein IPK76_26675 [Lewinellaceae bacterium]|nr:hypothetical protein [Lewinellaceae bacterium]